MSRTKKRHRRHLSHDVRAQSTPLNKRLRLSNSQANSTPRNHRDFYSESPAPPNTQSPYVRSDTPSPSSKANSRQVSSASIQSQQLNNPKHNAMPPPDHARSSSLPHPHRVSTDKKNEQRGRYDKHQFKPTKISPPADPRSSYLAAVKAQNRSRSQQPQTFTAPTSYEAYFTLEHRAGGKNKIDHNNNEDKAITAEIAETISEHGSSRETSTEVGSESDDNDNKERIIRNHIRYHDLDDDDSGLASNSDDEDSDVEQPRPQAHSNTKPALIGPDLVAELQRQEKAKMEKATQNAIAALHASPSLKKRKKHKSTTVSLLSTLDKQALDSLHEIIPLHILIQTRTQIESSSSTSSSYKHVATAKHNDDGDKTHATSVSTLNHTLTAARNLIVHLSHEKLGMGQPRSLVGSGQGQSQGTNMSANAGVRVGVGMTQGSNMQMQNELLRIVREREARITVLESELVQLKGDENNADSGGSSK